MKKKSKREPRTKRWLGFTLKRKISTMGSYWMYEDLSKDQCIKIHQYSISKNWEVIFEYGPFRCYSEILKTESVARREVEDKLRSLAKELLSMLPKRGKMANPLLKDPSRPTHGFRSSTGIV